ncbi:MAG: family 10 glycosylhydrolase [Muribaculaceae bacterium]|nr:family 10 glycosylhydrolase [Muribaculaceae bacterium]
MKKILLLLIVAASLFSGNGNLCQAQEAIKREYRATWMATVWRLDWPSVAGTSSSVITKQKQELINYLDKLEAMNMNAVCLQVRSMCDAFYQSSYEPWSSYLTGTRGANPGWDPLAFAVEECHKRGIELHAWVNPYRWATSSAGWSTSQDQQLINAGMLLTYTSGSTVTTILNPGLQQSIDRIVNVCRELAENYNIDGIIFDDYFYPSGIPTNSSADDYQLWQNSGTSLSFANWRRDNVNRMVQAVWDMLQETKPEVRFGIGPAGVAGTASTGASAHGVTPCPTGSDWQYNGIFSDPLAWLDDGTIDYISPQLYWKTNHSTNPFGPLTQWWSYVANHFGRHHFASHSISFLTSSNTQSDWAEVAAQIRLSRQYTENNAPGVNIYSAKNINGDNGGVSGLGNYLAANVFQHKALLPAVTWKEATPHAAPASLKLTGNRLSWEAQDGVLVKYSVYAIPTTVDDEEAMTASGDGIKSDYLIAVSYNNYYVVPEAYQSGYYYAVCVVDGFDNEWPAAFTGEATGYEPLIDIDTYDETQGYILTSNWIRSVKPEYDNITFENNGLYQRGMAVGNDNVYVTRRSANSGSADIFLDVYSKSNGKKLKTLTLGSEAQVDFAPVNDVFTDAVGNVLVSNLSLNIKTTPIYIFKVDTVTGSVTQKACVSMSDYTSRIDHCNVLGSVDDTEFTVMAAAASGNNIYQWKVRNGATVSSSYTYIGNFYPSSASNFGIAPRIYPMSATSAWVKGANVQLTRYDLSTGNITDNFASNTAIQAEGLNANGAAFFEWDGKHFMTYATADNGSSNGFQFALAVNGEDDGIAGMSKLWKFPAQGIGDVYSQTWSAPCVAQVKADGTGVDLYYYVPGCGLASYTLSKSAQQLIGDVNCDGNVTTADVTAIYNYLLNGDTTFFATSDVDGDGFITTTDITIIYNILLGN